MKEQVGKIATFAFIASAIFTIWSGSGLSSLFHLKNLAFIIVGIFVAPMTLGVGFYLFMKTTGDIFGRMGSSLSSSDTSRITKLMGIVGPIVFLLFLVLCYEVTQYAYAYIIVGDQPTASV